MGVYRALSWFVVAALPLLNNVSAHFQGQFEIDYENDQFLKDGKPFQYISGSLHYFRVPRFYWGDRLRKLRAAGLNTVCTYIEWSSHEQTPGKYDFSGDNDIEHFIKLAEQVGLLVILRPGPYICAERDLGGYPPWILHEKPDMVLRTNDSLHNQYVDKWFSVLMPRIQPLLYGNGGPVIMVQVENEYGSYITCDRNYTTWLRDLYRRYVGKNALLFTTDGNTSGFLKCGPIRGTFITVDFGGGGDTNSSFGDLRKIQPHGPLVNSEYYAGWITHWGRQRSIVDVSRMIQSTRDLLANNVSLNFYVFFGGSNFGFTSGANINSKGIFMPQITAYDYDAPITEAGDLTDKYFVFKSIISEFFTVPDIPVKNLTKMAYGRVALEPKVSLIHSNSEVAYKQTEYPLTFEVLGQYSGMVLYETILPPRFSGLGYLLNATLHDWAVVLEDGIPAGVLNRNAHNVMVIGGRPGVSLQLLVENQGRNNYKDLHDLKGLFNVSLDGEVLTNWKHTGYPLTDVLHIAALPTAEKVILPAFYSGRFQLPSSLETAHDTFVDMTGWFKGVLYVNEHNLGRYWPVKGPQITHYLPGPYLKKYPEYNTITILELVKENPDKSVKLVSEPIWK